LQNEKNIVGLEKKIHEDIENLHIMIPNVEDFYKNKVSIYNGVYLGYDMNSEDIRIASLQNDTEDNKKEYIILFGKNKNKNKEQRKRIVKRIKFQNQANKQVERIFGKLFPNEKYLGKNGNACPRETENDDEESLNEGKFVFDFLIVVVFSICLYFVY